MKTAVVLTTTMMMTAMVAAGASAEWRLYVNRDNRAWSLERTYLSNDECDRAARTMYHSGQALGVGCAEYPSLAAQTPASRPADYARPNPTTQRTIARADDSARISTTRSSAARTAAEYAARPTPRPVAAQRTAAAVAVTAPHPAAVIFPPTGGVEVRSEEASAPAVVASRPAPEPRRHAAPTPTAPQRPVEDPTAVALAKAAVEGSVVSAREMAAETAKREEAATADRAEHRNQLAILGGIALVALTAIAYSVYRASRTSALRALAVCLIELGLLTSALAYPAVELWNRLKVSGLMLSTWFPGLLAGMVVAGAGVIALALDMMRRSARPKATAAAPSAERRPVELIKPGEHVKVGDSGKSGEPVRPLTPIRPLEPVRPLDAAAPVEPSKPADAPVPLSGGSLADRLTR